MSKSSGKIHSLEHYYRVQFPSTSGLTKHREFRENPLEIVDLSDNPKYEPARKQDIHIKSIEYR